MTAKEIIAKCEFLVDDQQGVLRRVDETNDNLIVDAKAGSGKTFIQEFNANIEHAKGKRVLAITFSKALAEEFNYKVNKNKNICDVKTAHALAFGVIRSNKPARADARKAGWMIDDLEADMFNYDKATPAGKDGPTKREITEARNNLKDLVKFCKLNNISYEYKPSVREIARYYGLNSSDDFINYTIKIMKESEKFDTNTIDFTDMIWLAARLYDNWPKYDTILVDEVQDLSLVMIEIIKKSLAPDGRVILVGDPNQAIFGFAGSRNDSFQTVGKAFDCDTVPLRYNFRCGKAQIERAQRIVPEIRHSPNAPDGEVLTGGYDELIALQSGDMAIARVNSALVAPALKMIKEGKKATIKGKDLAKPIMDILAKQTGKDLDEAVEWIDRERDKLARMADKTKMSKARLEMLDEPFDIAYHFLAEMGSVLAAKDTVKSIFSEKGEGVVFSSAHRSKGLEANAVAIIDPDKIRISRDDMTEWQAEQEANLEYVAETRAKTKTLLIKK